MTIRVMVVDDHVVVRDAIAAMIDFEEDLEVVGQASDGRQAVERALAIQPEVILMDLRMPEMDGVAAMRELGERLPSVRFIVLTTFDTDEYIFDAIEAGARGFLLKDCSRQELFGAIRAVAAGESLIDPSVAGRVLDRFARMQRGGPSGPTLSERENEVLQLMAQGQPNKTIARHLLISESTVKTHVANIFQKLDAASRTEAVSKAVRTGLIKL